MSTIGTYQAKTEFSNLIRKVMRGERIIITRYGEPVAMLSPIHEGPSRPLNEVIEEIKAFRKEHQLGDLKLKEIIESGRA